MSVVYVLITSDLSFEKAVINQLKTIHLVKEMIEVMGTYDILAKLESKSSDDLRNVITSQIRKIPHIRTTLTLAAAESQE
jgi:DNA-binding Lrp family transcriptional regulator